jgi:hypothetical protein
MSNYFSLPIALRIPALEVDALIEGKIIAIIAKIFLNPGRQFSLYPGDSSLNPLPPEEYYHADFLDAAQTAEKNIEHGLGDNRGDETFLIKAWARCELCEMVNDVNAIAPLSAATIWTPAGLQAIINQGRSIFLTYLRVYHLAEPAAAPANSMGKFISVPLSVSSDRPILTDDQFTQYCQNLQQRKPREPFTPPPPIIPPLPPPFDRLQPALNQLVTTNQSAAYFNQELQQFLGLQDSGEILPKNPDLAWIKTITELGNRSQAEDAGKSNYQAGTDFENIVRQSLEFLGFTINYSHKGGAGGLDLFCSAPYPLVGECKAGKSIPNTTAVQLLNLATLRLQDSQLRDQAVKLIIGPGKPTKQLLQAAEVHKMSIIRPETLEKLVILESQCPRCIDLFKLKEYLQPGQSDDAIEKYIQEIQQQLKVRSHIVQLVKNHLTKTSDKFIGLETIYGAYPYSNPPEPLDQQQLYQILLELSSYFAGYLGRIPGNYGSKSDRFYFLRDLAIDV